MKQVLAAFLLCGVLTGCGCQIAHDFLPRTHTVATSPDGKYTAYVRQHFNNDPPDDHLYLGPANGRAQRLMDLAPDNDWCTTIVWTSDSRRVGFLIRDQRLAIFDAASGAHVGTVVLVVPDGYPGSQEARHVALNHDGTRVTFDRFDRAIMLVHRRAETIEAPLTTISPKRTEARPARNRWHEEIPISPEAVR